MKYIITLALVVTSAQLLAQWQADVQLNDNPVPSNISHNKSSIVANGDVLHVVWYERHGEDNDQIYYKRSINKGATWQAAKRITNNTRSTSEPILTVSGDIVNIFWIDNRADIYQTRSVTAGVSWSPEKKVTDDAYNPPSAAVSGSIIHLVWSGKVGQIYYKHSTNGGSTWGATEQLSDRNASSMPAIAVSDKEVHVVWQEKADGAGGSNGIFHKRSVDAGKIWEAYNKLAHEPSDFASIAVSGKEVYVTWRDNLPGKSIHIKNSPDGGLNWRDDKELTNKADFASVAVSGQFVHLVWRSSSQLNYKRSINGGVTWEPGTPILNSAGSPREYSLVANGQRIDMVWDNNQNVFYKRLLKESAKKALIPKGQNTTTRDEEKAEDKTDEQTDQKADEPKRDDKKPGEEKQNEKNNSEKWVITHTGAKGATGTVSINIPEGVEWHLDIKSSDDRALGKWDDRWNNKKTINLIPGKYNIFFTYIPVPGVPIQKGMNTRLKAGLLNVVTAGQWSIHNESKEKVYVIYYKPSKIALPVGRYNLQYNGQYIAIEIKEGEVTEF